MANLADILTGNIDVWTSAIERRSSAGRGRSKKFSLYGIEKLRALILDLAVRGKLVMQHPNEENASELVKTYRKMKFSSVKIGRGKKVKVSEQIQQAELPFKLPANWAWVRLFDIGALSGGMTPSMNRSDFWNGDIVWLSPKDIKSDELVDSELKISQLGLHKTGLELYPPGSLFMVARSGILQRTFPVSINRVAATANQDLKVLIPYLGGQERYLQIMFRGLTGFLLRNMVKTGTTVQSLKYAEFEQQPFPIPPLAEQHRIVAKVDELMALCDAMEAGTYEAIEAHELLVGNLLTTLTRSKNAEELAGNWARIETHFDTLFITEASIDQLKQTILQLAVMGKLVPQDPNDEPASELLKRISKEIAAYSKSEGIRPPQPDRIEAGTEPFTLPDSWQWTRLCSLFRVITDGDHQPPPKADSGVAFLTIGNVTTGTLDFEGCRLVPEAYFQSLAPYRTPAKGDILYTVVGATYGRPAIVETDRDFCVQRHIAILKPVENTDLQYMAWLLSSPLVYEQASKSTTGTAQPTIALRPLRNFAVPLPPLPEQRRIAAKIDELFGVCDALKARLVHAQRKQIQFADAVASKAVA